ncbi:hypothetical protein FACS189434_02930 [Bacteroidia bacterium]|nr:hypothetical protein FACS189434_02930 [Bacteroidia bacterium]
MNFIQTLYVTLDKNLFKDTFGWVSAEYHIMSWVLSCLQLNKIYGYVELFANLPAADLLIGMLNLPYAKVHTSHDNLKLAHNELWALPKLYTYSLQNEPFLHIDGDVFLFRKFDDSLLNGELIGQNIEVATEYYTSTQRELMQYFTYFPDCVKKDFDSGIAFNAVNAGILGGKKIDFFKEYTNFAIEYITRNEQHLKNINVNNFNIFFEQHLFFALAKAKNIPISVFFNGIIPDKGYKYMGDFHKAPNEISYLHLLGHFKRDEYTCNQMVAKLRELYPDYYYKILELFKKKEFPLSKNFCGYVELKDKTVDNENKIIENENTILSFLRKIKKTVDAEKDFGKFYKRLIKILNKNISILQLNKRDAESVKWYKKCFYSENFLETMIVKCPEVKIISSEYNWSGMFNKFYRVGVQYYEHLKFEKGKFYHLIVLEVSQNRFLLYDIDELDNKILKNLTEPTSMRDFLKTISQYFEDDVIENHYDTFFSLIKQCLSQLILKKAIKPV